MKLYLVRHGEAGSAHSDAERPLTERGVVQVKRLADYLAESDAHPSHIYHSGLLRAKQTADIIAEKLHMLPVVKKVAYLGSEDPIEFIKLEAEYWKKDTILVGHMPYMGILLMDLMASRDVPGFHTATGVCLERQGEKWVLVWVFHGSDD